MAPPKQTLDSPEWASPEQIKTPRQLLVEGNDQRNFFEAFVKRLSLCGIQIQDYGGGDELRGFLRIFVKMTDFHSVKSLGIVRDAEDFFQNTFRSVQGALRHANLPVPKEAGQRQGGQGGKPDVSVFILPDNASPGMLETLLCRAFANSEENICIDNFFKCVKVVPNVKARAFAYLTTRRDAHHSVGVAAQQGVWNLDDAAFQGLRDFLKKL